MQLNDKLSCITAIGILAILVITFFMTTPTNGDFWWYDSSRHAMNGVFIHDFFLEGRLFHPISFASEYYHQYPAINVGFYPLFFYFSSAPFLAFFGVSHAVSQAVVALYVFVAGIFAYLILRRTMDGFVAVSAAVSMLCLPEMAFWSRQVQIDVPAIALLLATAWYLLRYRDSMANRHLFAATVCLGLAVMTRVQVVFAVPPVLYFIFLRRRRTYNTSARTCLVALLTLAFFTLPSMAMVLYFGRIHKLQATNMPGMPKLMTIENWIWYARQLPDQLGWAALIFIIFGLLSAIVLAIRRSLPTTGVITFNFCIFSWFFFSLISNKEPRFNLPSLPFLFLLAAICMVSLLPQVTRLALPLLAAWLVWQSVAVVHVPVATGFKEAALATQKLTPRDANVLISAHRDGNFIYNMRVLGDRRDIGIRRADKHLAYVNISQVFGVRDLNYDHQAIRNFLNTEHIATIVVQEGYLSDQPSIQRLQDLLDEGNMYKPVQTITLTDTMSGCENRLTVYTAVR